MHTLLVDQIRLWNTHGEGILGSRHGAADDWRVRNISTTQFRAPLLGMGNRAIPPNRSCPSLYHFHFHSLNLYLFGFPLGSYFLSAARLRFFASRTPAVPLPNMLECDHKV